MVSADGSGPADPGASSSGDDELLEEFEERLVIGEDPVGALAAVLSGRARRRTELFAWTGRSVMGFRLERILGAGGTGVTYAAASAEQGRAAVKLVVLSGGSSEARFERECELLESFSHPSIVSYRGHAVVEPGIGALIMERVDAVDFEQVLVELDAGRPVHPAAVALQADVEGGGAQLRGSPLFLRRVLLLLAECADGLAVVHASDVVHRDVKPANILVDGELKPTLIDFGFAREWDPASDLTMSGVAIGTLSYMAPEQVSSKAGAISGATDTYALGLVLYRALVGRLPHAQLEELASTRRRQIRLQPEDKQRIPRPVVAVLERALQRDPRRRYHAAADMAQHLRDAAAGKDVPRIAPPLGPTLVTAALAVALLVAGLLLAWSGEVAASVEVVFRANCRNTDAVVALAGGERVFLDEPIRLAPGVYDAQLEGERVYGSRVTFSVPAAPAPAPLQVAMLTQYTDLAGEDRRLDAQHSLVQFMSGHSLVPIAPGLERDQRWIDDQPVEEWGPFPTGAQLPFGRHVFRAIDGLGRIETQEVEVGPAPVDLVLLPSVLDGVHGEFRCTWSSVLSPRPAALTVVHDGSRWIGPAQASTVGGGGLMALPCGLTVGAGGQATETLLEVRFPEPMKRAVAYLRSLCAPVASLQLEAAMGDGDWSPWPRDAQGGYEPQIELIDRAGALRLRVRARMRAPRAPTRGRTDVQILHGMLFGGHWNDDPPCFAVAAMKELKQRIRLLQPPRELSPERQLQIAEAATIDDGGRSAAPATIGPLVETADGPRLLLTALGGAGLSDGFLHEWDVDRWERTATRPLAPLHPDQPSEFEQGPWKGYAFVRRLPTADEPGSLLISFPTYPRSERLSAGRLLRVDRDASTVRWQAPLWPPSEPFGDDSFGKEAFVSFAGAEADQVVVSEPRYRDAGGNCVGRLHALDPATGELAWQHVGTGQTPVTGLRGLLRSSTERWAVYESANFTKESAPILSTRLLALSLEAQPREVLIQQSAGGIACVTCRSTRTDAPDRIVTATNLDQNALALKSYDFEGADPTLRAQHTHIIPDGFSDLRVGERNYLYSTPDLDGDGVEDCLFLTVPSWTHDGEKRSVRWPGSQFAAVFSSARLSLLGWIRVPDDSYLIEATALPGDKIRLVGLLGTLIDGALRVQVVRYEPR